MAIAYNNATHTAFAVNTKTQAHTTAGDDRYIFFHLYVGTSATPSTITYGGVALSLIQTFAMTGAAAGQYIRTYGLVNPASGSNNAVVTFGTSPGFYVSIVSYTGVDQTNPIDTSGNNGTSPTTSLTTTLTTTADNCWLVGYAYMNGSLAAGANTTLRGGSVSGVLQAMDTNAAQTPPGNHSLTTTGANAFAGHVVAAIAPAGGVGAVKPNFLGFSRP